MRPAGEQPPELPTPRPAGDSVRLEAHASDQARIHQAARDFHVHYQDGVRGARRVEAGAEVRECPYPGLASFERTQARWFFGRDQPSTAPNGATQRTGHRSLTGGRLVEGIRCLVRVAL